MKKTLLGKFFGLILMGNFYLLPSQFLLEEDLKQRDKLRTLSINQEVVLIDKDLPNNNHFSETIFLERMSSGKNGNPGRMIIESRLPVDNQGAAVTTSRRLLTDSELSPSELLWMFYLIHDSKLLSQKLSAYFSLQKNQLEKFGNRIAYRIGDPQSQQYLWFDKDFIHPLGYTLKTKQGKLEVRWDEKPAYNNEIYLPQELQIFLNDQLVEKRTISGIRINTLSTTELFRSSAPSPTMVPSAWQKQLTEFRGRYY